MNTTKDSQLKFLRDATAAAVAVEQHTGIPAELLLAQAILESGWGKHAPGNNCFGIKATDRSNGRQLLQTREWFTDAELERFLALGNQRTAKATGQVNGSRKEYAVRDWFAAYPSLAACFDARAQLFLVGRYKPFAEQFIKDGNVEALVRGIAPIYATAENYADELLKIIRQQNVQLALAGSRPPDHPEAA